MAEYRESKINFSNPLKGRQWLKLLKPDGSLGMTFIPGIYISNRKKLGFRFKANYIGFHGKECCDAENVILGTSFGMGFGVDEGQNWHQFDKYIENNFFNLALPVAPFNHKNALEKFYKGSYKTLIYVYHPNVWKIASGFYKANSVGKDIFTFMRWKTDVISLIKLIPKWLLKRVYFWVNGIELTYKSNKNKYTINTYYNKYNCANEIYESSKSDLIDVFNEFDRVLLFRVPIKEQILNSIIQDKKLNLLNDNYEKCWESFLNDPRLSENNKVEIIDLYASEDFTLDDYLPNDTHWSPSGNRKFSTIVSQKISRLLNE